MLPGGCEKSLFDRTQTAIVLKRRAQVYYLDQSTFGHAVLLEQSDEEIILVCTGSVLLEESSKENGTYIRNLDAEPSCLWQLGRANNIKIKFN